MSQNIKQLLEKLRLSKGFRSLSNEQQAVIKVSILSRNASVINHMQRLLEQESQGLDFDQETIRLLSAEILQKDKAPHIQAYKEAASRQEDDLFLNKLLSQFEEDK